MSLDLQVAQRCLHVCYKMEKGRNEVEKGKGKVAGAVLEVSADMQGEGSTLSELDDNGHSPWKRTRMCTFTQRCIQHNTNGGTHMPQASKQAAPTFSPGRGAAGKTAPQAVPMVGRRRGLTRGN